MKLFVRSLKTSQAEGFIITIHYDSQMQLNRESELECLAKIKTTDHEKLVGGSQQETLDPGFVLLGTRQQGAPVILRELVLPGGFDLASRL
ncbi:unnamed protein product [Schistosoma curassoni]|uniref:Uncharacterized protein n=1 Tax=Schistosoma curassoni TaxID=6186 RepID=A0A183JJ19_9TREM|nr:unnamed protein product [Schistosoma curassoni]